MPNVADKPRYVLLCIQNNSSIKQKTTTFREEKKTVFTWTVTLRQDSSDILLTCDGVKGGP